MSGAFLAHDIVNWRQQKMCSYFILSWSARSSTQFMRVITGLVYLLLLMPFVGKRLPKLSQMVYY